MNELPQGILKTDLKYPKFSRTRNSGEDFDRDLPYEDRQFELWHVPGFGWCIPTLHIRNAGRRAVGSVAPRTYAVKVDDGSTCRIGLGPHVKDRVTVYVRKNRVSALRRFIDLKNTGSERANMIRDRISTRRAQGVMRRQSFYGGF